jgi:DNA-directed RNA polymerase specialized sigma24 family protein
MEAVTKPGSDRAWTEARLLYVRFIREVRAHARKFLRDRAAVDDVAQEVFVAAFNQCKRDLEAEAGTRRRLIGVSEDDQIAWLKTVTRNKCVDRIKVERRARPTEDVDVAAALAQDGPLERAVSRDMVERLWKVLDMHVTPKEREVVVLAGRPDDDQQGGCRSSRHHDRDGPITQAASAGQDRGDRAGDHVPRGPRGRRAPDRGRAVSENKRETAMDEKPVTIREAFDGLDEYLVEQDSDFDVSAGLVDLWARIDRQEASRSDGDDQLARRDTLGNVAVAPWWKRRMILDLTDRRAAAREREGVVAVEAVAGVSVLTSVLIAVAHLPWVAVVGLVVVVVAMVSAVTLTWRWSLLGDREFFSELVRDPLAGDAPRPGPVEAGKNKTQNDPSKPSVAIDEFHGELHVENHGTPRSVDRGFSAWGWIAIIAPFGAASWSAIEGVPEPLVALARLLALATVATLVIVFGIPMISSFERRESAERVLAMILGRGKVSDRQISSAGIGGRRPPSRGSAVRRAEDAVRRAEDVDDR